MDSVKLLEKTKKQLRSVLISEKGGVAADRLERDYRDLVMPNLLIRGYTFYSREPYPRWVKAFLSEPWGSQTLRLSFRASQTSVPFSGVVPLSLFLELPARAQRTFRFNLLGNIFLANLFRT